MTQKNLYTPPNKNSKYAILLYLYQELVKIKNICLPS